MTAPMVAFFLFVIFALVVIGAFFVNVIKGSRRGRDGSSSPLAGMFNVSSGSESHQPHGHHHHHSLGHHDAGAHHGGYDGGHGGGGFDGGASGGHH